jgi:hypothetical protein
VRAQIRQKRTTLSSLDKEILRATIGSCAERPISIWRAG